MTKQKYSLLTRLLKMSQEDLLETLPRILSKYYHTSSISARPDYIYVTGDIPICLVAHLDTAHPIYPINFFHDQEQKMIWSPEGLGADDRAGIYAILALVGQGHKPSIIFTTDEEIGGIGAWCLLNDFPVPIVPTNFMIELDRQGKNEAVYYNCGNVAFERYITSFGFTTHIGSFSDISIIAPRWDIAAVNLSVGYENEHTQLEILYYEDLFRTINKVEKILLDPGSKKYSFDSKRKYDGWI